MIDNLNVGSEVSVVERDYDDSEPMTYHHCDIPECLTGNWEGDDT